MPSQRARGRVRSGQADGGAMFCCCCDGTRRTSQFERHSSLAGRARRLSGRLPRSDLVQCSGYCTVCVGTAETVAAEKLRTAAECLPPGWAAAGDPRRERQISLPDVVGGDRRQRLLLGRACDEGGRAAAPPVSCQAKWPDWKTGNPLRRRRRGSERTPHLLNAH